jgi:hypothetical protein
LHAALRRDQCLTQRAQFGLDVVRVLDGALDSGAHQLGMPADKGFLPPRPAKSYLFLLQLVSGAP